MRAILLSTEEIQSKSVSVEGERYRHLVQVCRLKEGETILLLDGQGKRASGVLSEIKKREATLSIENLESVASPHFLSAFIGCPKKEAVEEILRRATELGLREVILYESEFSTWKFAPNARFDKIIESALIQSNNFWRPQITWCAKSELEQTLARFKSALFLHPYPESFGETQRLQKSQGVDLIAIGPEAGWSSSECEAFIENSNMHPVRLPTPILRAEHALSVAAGYAFTLNDN